MIVMIIANTYIGIVKSWALADEYPSCWMTAGTVAVNLGRR